MSRLFAARALSIIGHPALLMPIAIAAAAAAAEAPPQLLRVAFGSAVAVAAVVGLFSLWQVRAGRWLHVDASRPSERRQLTRLLAVLLGAIALALWASGQTSAVAALVGLLALGVAWSRLELRRHTRAEVLAGLLLGALSGAALQLLLA